MLFDLYRSSKIVWLHVCDAHGQIGHAPIIAYFTFRLTIYSNNRFIHADVKDFFLHSHFVYFLMSKCYSETILSIIIMIIIMCLHFIPSSKIKQDTKLSPKIACLMYTLISVVYG